MVDRHRTRRRLDLHPHSIQLESDNLCPLQQQEATLHYTANTVDRHGSRNFNYAHTNGMESALATVAEGWVGLSLFAWWFVSLPCYWYKHLKQISADVRCFSAMISSCVRYSTLFFQNDDATCKLSIHFSHA